MARPKSDETKRREQRRFLAKTLANPEISDEFLQCMDPSQGHDWELLNDFHIVPASTVGRRLTHIARDYQCGRCTKVKTETYVHTKRDGVEVLDRVSLKYNRIEGFDQWRGIPRGVKPSEIVHAEQYRRAMEKAVGAARGQKAVAER